MVHADRRCVRRDEIQHRGGPFDQTGGHIEFGSHLLGEQVTDVLGFKPPSQHLRAGIGPQLEGELLGKYLAGSPQQKGRPTRTTMCAGDQTQESPIQPD